MITHAPAKRYLALAIFIPALISAAIAIAISAAMTAEGAARSYRGIMLFVSAIGSSLLPFCTALFTRKSGPQVTLWSTVIMQAFNFFWLTTTLMVYFSMRYVTSNPKFASDQPLRDPHKRMPRSWWVFGVLAAGVLLTAAIILAIIPALQEEPMLAMLIFFGGWVILALPLLLGIGFVMSWGVAQIADRVAVSQRRSIALEYAQRNGN